MDCINCRYSLEGLPDTGVCPECGFSITASRNFRARPILWQSRAGRVFLGVFLGAVGEIAAGMYAGPVLDALDVERGPPFNPQLILIVGGVYSLFAISLWGVCWCYRTPEERIPRGVIPLTILGLFPTVIALFLAATSLGTAE